MTANMEGKTSERRDVIAVVERAFFVLRTVAGSGEPLGIRELARRTDLSPATTLRLVRTLEALGMVQRHPSGVVVLGPGVDTLTGDSPTAPTADQFLPLLTRLVEAFSEAATAGIDDGDHTLFVAHVAPDSAVQVADVTGDRWPAHTTASGIVLMGAWEPARLDNYLDGDLSWNAPGTITDPAVLRRRVDAARSGGFAWSVEELVADAAGLAVPLVDGRDRTVAAVGLYAPTYRLHPDLPATKDLPARLVDMVERLGGVVTGR